MAKRVASATMAAALPASGPVSISITRWVTGADPGRRMIRTSPTWTSALSRGAAMMSEPAGAVGVMLPVLMTTGR